jgi:hypothetical protein
VVERHVANVNVEGSTPFTRFYATAHGHEWTVSRFCLHWVPKNLSGGGTGFATSEETSLEVAMPQSKNLAASVGLTQRVASAAPPLRFDAERAVAGIAFHLIDEGVSRSVQQDSMRRTLNRLRQQSFLLSISAHTWAAMTNGQRLRRLLDETETEAALLPDDTAILIQRRLARR